MSTKHTKPAKHTGNTSSATARMAITATTPATDMQCAAECVTDTLCDLSYNVLLPIAGREGDAALALAAARIIEADEHAAPGYLNDAALALCRIEGGKTTAHPRALAANLLRIAGAAFEVDAYRRAKEEKRPE